jgi:flavin reductase (DIM6/NTAB) family NADH-FMN oxidoreductase RutF
MIMPPKSRLREALKRVIFGPQNFAQQCPLGMRDPQSEIIVRLWGLGGALDVTHRHMMACGFPFTIGIALDEELAAKSHESKSLSLSFHERDGHRRLLGKIALRAAAQFPAGNEKLCLFQPRSYSNYCLPKPWLWSRYLYYARSRSSPQTAEMALTLREVHSMSVFYICPRPVVLATVAERNAGNVFPMNLMGAIDEDYFSFALNATRPVTSVVESIGRIVLSSIPLEQASLTMALGKNHRAGYVPWGDLRFETKKSTLFGAPVPAFALRVREMQIESVREVGSHKLFVARVLRDERYADGAEFFVVHGIYQAYRERSGRFLDSLQSAPGLVAR